MRVVGVDLGTRRIGLAVTDSRQVLATPYSVIERTGDGGADRAAVRNAVEELGAQMVVVGLPLSLDGAEGPAARAARAEARALAAELAPMPVEMFDERFTTVSAAKALAEGGHDGRARRQRVDASAAAVMLQAWVDRRRTQ